MSSGSEKYHQSDEREHDSGPNRGKSKRVTLIPSKKDRNRLEKQKIRASNSNFSSISLSVGCFGRRVSGRRGGNGGGVGGCFQCFKNGKTWGSKAESPTSDPNSAEFTHEMLRDLIEKNDFYSKECNLHGIVDKVKP